MVHFLPFYHPYNLENQNFQKIKKASWDVIILHMCTKNHDHNDVWLLRYEMRPTELLCHFGPFLHFYHPKNPKNKNFEKIKKNIWRYYHFTIVHYKWHSYDEWFLKYWENRQNFVILDHSLPFYPPNNLEN